MLSMPYISNEYKPVPALPPNRIYPNKLFVRCSKPSHEIVHPQNLSFPDTASRAVVCIRGGGGSEATVGQVTFSDSIRFHHVMPQIGDSTCPSAQGWTQPSLPYQPFWQDLQAIFISAVHSGGSSECKWNIWGMLWLHYISDPLPEEGERPNK